MYDPTASFPAVVQEFGPNGRNMIYIRDPDGSLVAREDVSQGYQRHYYYFDALGSTVLITNGVSTITDRYDYGAWGEEHPILATTTDNPYRYVGQLGYYHHWMDPNLADFLHLGVRFYEPEVARFGQLDPIRDGLNWHAYAHSSPTYLVDPSGLAGFCYKYFSKRVATCTIYETGKRPRTEVFRDSDPPVDTCGDRCASSLSLILDCYGNQKTKWTNYKRPLGTRWDASLICNGFGTTFGRLPGWRPWQVPFGEILGWEFPPGAQVECDIVMEVWYKLFSYE